MLLSCIEKTLDVLSNKKPKFIHDEGANLIFLIGRVFILNPRLIRNDKFQKAIDFISTQINNQEPTLLSILIDFKFNIKEKPFISGYPDEFPSKNNNLMIITRVMVAEALASWTYYNKDINKINHIVKISLKQFDKTTKLKFQQTKLIQKSEFLIYFLTHIILIATMWGEIKTKTFPLWITTQLKKWIEEIYPKRSYNLEIWLELLFCLKLLDREEEDIYKKETLELLDISFSSNNNPHCVYHTFALWSLYIAILD